MSRWKAFAIHLAISAFVALVFLLVCRFYWFDGPLFAVMGGLGLLSILIPVDVILGPVLTLLVFKAGKPKLKLDLSLIAFIQLAALIYGAVIMVQARPLYVVLYHEELRVVRPMDLAKMPWMDSVLSPTRFVRVSGDIGALADIEEQMAELTGGVPPHLKPENYQPIEAHKEELRASLTTSLPTVLKGFQRRLDNLLERLPSSPKGYGAIPIKARGGMHVAVFERESLELVTILSAI